MAVQCLAAQLCWWLAAPKGSNGGWLVASLWSAAECGTCCAACQHYSHGMAFLGAGGSEHVRYACQLVYMLFPPRASQLSPASWPDLACRHPHPLAVQTPTARINPNPKNPAHSQPACRLLWSTPPSQAGSRTTAECSPHPLPPAPRDPPPLPAHPSTPPSRSHPPPSQTFRASPPPQWPLLKLSRRRRWLDHPPRALQCWHKVAAKCTMPAEMEGAAAEPCCCFLASQVQPVLG